MIGDGSLSGGEALEGLDYAAELGGNLIIVVNDNDMSIAENHGGIYQNLKLLRETNGQAECNLFCAMGLDYIYVDHGNDVAELIQAFASVKDSKKAIVVHINTLKGKGYAPAEQHKEQWHFNGPFHIETGKPLYEMEEEDYSDVTCNYLMKKMKEDPAVVAITSGTPTVWDLQRISEKQQDGSSSMSELQKRQRLHWRQESQQMAESRSMVCIAHLYREPLIRLHRMYVSTTAR